MNSITIFCGSSSGSDKLYSEEAFKLGKLLALKNIKIIYGGAKVGIMGAVADGALTNNGHVTGVIPSFLMRKEIAHDALSEMVIVDTMHERKTKMNELCDGVIALSGGIGTLEELFEMLTWAQLGLHQKPIGILNTNGFYDALIILLKHMVTSGFLRQENFDMIQINEHIEPLLHSMEAYVAPQVEKWITKETT